MKVGTFSKSGTTFTPRSVETIGNVTGGSKQTFDVSLDVKAGDYLGFYSATGAIELDIAGGVAVWSVAGDQTGAATTYSESVSGAISIHGTGDREVTAYVDYGRNMESISRKKDLKDLVTKLYPHGAYAGADQIGISTVEPSGFDYITNNAGTYGTIVHH